MTWTQTPKIIILPQNKPPASLINSKITTNSEILRFKHTIERLQLEIKQQKEDFEYRLESERQLNQELRQQIENLK